MPRKRTHDEYVAQVDALDKGFTVVGEYVNNRTKIAHRCVEGHEWETVPNNILMSGSGCPHCAGMVKKTHSEYVAELAVKRPDLTVIGEYVNSMTKIEHRCAKGHRWETRPNAVLRGANCWHCKASRKKSHKEYVEAVRKLNKGFTVVGKYIDSNTKITHRCHKGHEWQSSPRCVVTSKTDCPFCIGKKITHEDYVRQVESLGKGIKVIGRYSGTNTAIKHQCAEGHQWDVQPSNIKSGTGCPYCAGKVFCHDDYVDFLANNQREIRVVERYINDETPINHQCSKGHIWKSSPNKQKQRSKCSICSGRRSDANVFYIWENTQDPGVYKVGITSQRAAEKRVTGCASRNNMTPAVILMASTPNARDIERRALELGDDPRYPSTIDGYTEFRRYSDAELGEVWRMAVGA